MAEENKTMSGGRRRPRGRRLPGVEPHAGGVAVDIAAVAAATVATVIIDVPGRRA